LDRDLAQTRLSVRRPGQPPGTRVPSALLRRPRILPGFLEPPRFPDRPSIAVLPFQNISADPRTRVTFADGMADEIIHGAVALFRRCLSFAAETPASLTRAGAVDVKNRVAPPNSGYVTCSRGACGQGRKSRAIHRAAHRCDKPAETFGRTASMVPWRTYLACQDQVTARVVGGH